MSDEGAQNRWFRGLSRFCNCDRKATVARKSHIWPLAQLTWNWPSIVFFASTPHGYCIGRYTRSSRLNLAFSGLLTVSNHAAAEPRASGEREGIVPAMMQGLIIGGNVDALSETTNVVRFPMGKRLAISPVAKASCRDPGGYEFTEGELAALCRWFSAMKYAFPGTEGVMVVSHQHGYSAVGLYHPARGVPNCLVAKHEVSGNARFFWSTEVDPP